MLKKLQIFILLIVICFPGISSSEENNIKKNSESKPCEEYKDGKPGLNSERRIIETNLDPSYITLGAGINLDLGRDGYGHSDDLFFEAELNQHLHFFDIPKTGLLKGFIKINPKVQLRMSNKKSSPVETPGFLPRATYFFWFNDMDKEEKFTYYSIMLSHHSNGQSGDFYNADGTVNTESGNFSTNYFEFANCMYKRKYLPEWTKFSLLWHPGFNREDNLDDQYEEVKIEISTRSTLRSLTSIWPSTYKWSSMSDWYFKLFSSISYIVYGRDYIVAPNPDYPQIKPQRSRWTDNINLSFNLCIRPPQFNDMTLFIKYDFGYDYYNINFQREFNRIQIGIAGDPFGVFK